MFQMFSARLRAAAARDLSETGLRAAVIAAALVFIVLALTVKSKWALAGLLAYIALP